MIIGRMTRSQLNPQKFRLGRFVAVGAIVAAVGGVGYAAGAIPGADGKITACYANSSGALRVIDASGGATCDARKEKLLTFNQTGPTGPAGPAGPAGPPGESGTSLWARATFYLGGTIQHNTGNGVVTYTGTTGHYLVTFPQSVVDCAAVVTANEGNNTGWVALYETANIAYDPAGNPNALAVSLMDARNGGFVDGYGFNIIVSC